MDFRAFIANCNFMVMTSVTFLALTAVRVAAIDPPLNTAVVAGQPATFSCASDETIRWDYYAYKSKQPQTVYNGDKVADAFSNKVYVIKSGRTSSLTVIRTSLDDTGYFVCFESGKTARYTASLNVLSAASHCTTNLSSSFTVDRSDSVQVSCTVNFSGNWTPIIACTPGIDDRALNNVTRTTIPHTVTYKKTVPGSSIVDGTVFNCSTSFQQGVAPTTSVPHSADSDNIPSYFDSWSSPPIRVIVSTSTTTASTPGDKPSQQQQPTERSDTDRSSKHLSSSVEPSTTTTTTAAAAAAVATTTSRNEEHPSQTVFTQELQFSLSAGHVIGIALSLVGLLVIAIIIIVVLVVVVFNRRRAREAIVAHPSISIAPGPHTHSHYRNDTMSMGGTWHSMGSSSNSYRPGGTLDNGHYSVIREFPGEGPAMKLGLATGAMNNPEYVCGSETYMEIADVPSRQSVLTSGYQVPSGLRTPVKPQPNYQTLDRTPDDEASASGGSMVPLIDPYAIKRLGQPAEFPDQPVIVTEYLTPAELANEQARVKGSVGEGAQPTNSGGSVRK